MKALIVCGDGINCERETVLAFNEVNISSEIVHLNSLIENSKIIHQYQVIALPGGFSFGDELNSGTVLSHKIKYGIGEDFQRFVEQKPVIGICNGFQALVQLGIFGNASLEENKSHQFINKWTEVIINKNDGPWLHGFELYEKFYLPIRHQEGNLQSTYPILSNSIGVTYANNPNGSQQNIAGLVSSNNLALGLMPHPEIAIYKENSFQRKNNGLKFFSNLFKYLQ